MTSFTTPRRLRRRRTAATVALGAVTVLMSGAGASSVATSQQTGSASYQPTVVASESTSAETVDDPSIPALVPMPITTTGEEDRLHPVDQIDTPKEPGAGEDPPDDVADDGAAPIHNQAPAPPLVEDPPVSDLSGPALPAFELPAVELPDIELPELPPIVPPPMPTLPDVSALLPATPSILPAGGDDTPGGLATPALPTAPPIPGIAH